MMIKILDKLIPKKEPALSWFAVLASSAIIIMLVTFGIYLLGEYGIALFVVTPLIVGFLPVLIKGYRKTLTKKESMTVSYGTLILLCFLMLALAFEGIICLVMAAPIMILMTFIGSLLGYKVIQSHQSNFPLTIGLIVILMPVFMAFDVHLTQSGYDKQLTPVTTTVEIAAPIETVWKNVVEFPEMDAPQEWLFKTGISYPIRARIEGKGVGAIRYCEFSTGAFVEPIDEWNAPYSLKFHVIEQPFPMKELSPYGEIHPPHLEHYFISKKGQFQLESLPNGNTRLEGTTWYYTKIRPAFYWNEWCAYLIHAIHGRVLNHIKQQAESTKS